MPLDTRLIGRVVWIVAGGQPTVGWTVVAICQDGGISGTKGREKRPELDALLKGGAGRDLDLLAA